MNGVITEKNLKRLISSISRSFSLIGPKKLRENYIFTYLDGKDKLDLSGYGNTVLSPKEFFFPQNETLYRFRKNLRSFRPATTFLRAKKRILFGIRACDLAGLLFLDRVFLEDIPDPFYKILRENTLIFALSCQEPGDNCFCRSMGSGPEPKEAYDLLFTPLKDRYLVEIGSLKGEKFIEKRKRYFSPVRSQDLAQKERILNRLKAKLRAPTKKGSVARRLDSLKRSRLWDDIAKRCLRCGGCTTVCPTCFCFNIVERENGPTGGERFRTWDSCQFAGFTRMAGDVNPRAEKPARIRQFFYHKLNYTVKTHNTLSCVGCGRCINACIGDISIKKIIAKVTRQKV